MAREILAFIIRKYTSQNEEEYEPKQSLMETFILQNFARYYALFSFSGRYHFPGNLAVSEFLANYVLVFLMISSSELDDFTFLLLKYSLFQQSFRIRCWDNKKEKNFIDDFSGN